MLTLLFHAGQSHGIKKTMILTRLEVLKNPQQRGATLVIT